MYVELASHAGGVPTDQAAWSAAVDAELRRAHFAFGSYRDRAAVGAPRVRLVAPGTFAALRAALVDSGAMSANQLKVLFVFFFIIHLFEDTRSCRGQLRAVCCGTEIQTQRFPHGALMWHPSFLFPCFWSLRCLVLSRTGSLLKFFRPALSPSKGRPGGPWGGFVKLPGVGEEGLFVLRHTWG